MLVLIPVAAILSTVAYLAVALPGCTSCHERELISATGASSHAEVECRSCHVSPGLTDRAAFGVRQLFHMQLRLVSGEGREWSAVPDERCMACHESVQEEVVNANGISVKHSDCAKGSSCTDCHSTVAHGKSRSWTRVYDMETCLECHVSESQTDCELCHQGGERAEDRITSGVFAVTHGKDWQKTHGMGNASTCTVCHTAATCERCHGPGLPHDSGFLETHGGFAGDAAAKCDDCHSETFCTNCHGVEMPHTAAFTEGHAEPAAKNRDVCSRCHVESDCVTCHVKHIHPGGAVDPGTPLGGGQ